MPASLKQRDHTPERTADQRREALALANRMRAQRAALKLQLKQGSISIAALISDPPQCLGTAKISEPLMARLSTGRSRPPRASWSAAK